VTLLGAEFSQGTTEDTSNIRPIPSPEKVRLSAAAQLALGQEILLDAKELHEMQLRKTKEIRDKLKGISPRIMAVAVNLAQLEAVQNGSEASKEEKDEAMILTGDRDHIDLFERGVANGSWHTILGEQTFDDAILAERVALLTALPAEALTTIRQVLAAEVDIEADDDPVCYPVEQSRTA